MSMTLEDMMVPLAPLLKILQCPVCLDVVKIPFKTCHNGHLVCNECNDNLLQCPICRTNFVSENPNAVKNVLEALPRPCRHSPNGCQEILSPEGDDHERFCGYRPVGCSSHNCPQRHTLLALELRDHYQLHHERNCDTSDIYTWSFEPLLTVAASPVSCTELSTTEEFWIPIYLYGTFFWIVVRQCDGGFYELYFQAVFVGRPADDVFVRLKFERDGVGCVFTLRASLHDDCWADGVSYVMLHENTLHRYVLNDALNFGYEIYTAPK